MKPRKRSFTHAVRNQSNNKLIHDGVNIIEKIKTERERVFKFSNEIITGNYLGFSGKKYQQ